MYDFFFLWYIIVIGQLQLLKIYTSGRKSLDQKAYPITSLSAAVLQRVAGQPSLRCIAAASLLIRASLSLLLSGIAQPHLFFIRDRQLCQPRLLFFDSLLQFLLSTLLLSLLCSGGGLRCDHVPSHTTGLFPEQRGNRASHGE